MLGELVRLCFRLLLRGDARRRRVKWPLPKDKSFGLLHRARSLVGRLTNGEIETGVPQCSVAQRLKRNVTLDSGLI